MTAIPCTKLAMLAMCLWPIVAQAHGPPSTLATGRPACHCTPWSGTCNGRSVSGRRSHSPWEIRVPFSAAGSAFGATAQGCLAGERRECGGGGAKAEPRVQRQHSPAFGIPPGLPFSCGGALGVELFLRPVDVGWPGLWVHGPYANHQSTLKFPIGISASGLQQAPRCERSEVASCAWIQNS